MSQVQVFPVTPMAKPRMTRRDKWKKRAVVERYNAFKDECRIWQIALDPNRFYHVVFVIQMPRSISAKERSRRLYRPHQQKPDKDNLEKALLDALFTDDAAIWDGRISKVWGERGAILLSRKPINLSPKALRAVLEPS